MFSLIQKFRLRRLLRAISLLTVFSFLGGEFFNCCFINHAFATKIEKIVTSLTQAEKTRNVFAVMEDEYVHSECHGHSKVQENVNTAEQSQPSVSEHSMPMFNSVAIHREEHCISGQSITHQSMVGNLSLTLEFPAEQVGSIVESILPPLCFLTHPRPQNKSSPPLFLRTLQILV